MSSAPVERGGDLAQVVAAGDLLASLEALRDELARAVMGATSGAKAQTAAQLRAVLAEIEALRPSAKKVTKADELAARRRARLAASQQMASAGGDGN